MSNKPEVTRADLTLADRTIIERICRVARSSPESSGGYRLTIAQDNGWDDFVSRMVQQNVFSDTPHIMEQTLVISAEEMRKLESLNRDIRHGHSLHGVTNTPLR